MMIPDMHISEPMDLSKLPELVEINDILPNKITVGHNKISFDQWVIDNLHTTSARLRVAFGGKPLNKQEIIEHFDNNLFTL